MKKKLIAVLALAMVVALCAVMTGCGKSIKYHVYEIDKMDDGYVEYDIIYYEDAKEPVMTGYVDESHYYKTNWTREQVEKLTDQAYPGADDMSFASVSISDEGDYYCVIVEFKDLDKLENLTTMYQNKCLFATSRTEAEQRVSAKSFESSVKSQGGELIDESDIKDLGLHYKFSK